MLQQTTVRCYNPMFPQRPMPQLDAKTEEGEGATDFLSMHGGKVALGALGIAIALIYSWYKGGVNRNNLEDELSEKAIIEPYEIQELRLSNGFISGQDFDDIVRSCYATCSPAGMSYREFIQFVKKHQQQQQQASVGGMNGGGRSGFTIQSCHLLDRVVAGYVLRSASNVSMEGDTSEGFSSSVGTDSSAASPATTSFADVSLPRGALLTALNMTVNANFVERVDELFDIAHLEASANTGGFSSSGGSNSLVTSPSSTGYGSNESYNSANAHSNSNNGDEDSYVPPVAERISKQDAVRLIRYLVNTDQVPAEKRVIETGVKWPVKTWRVKTPEEMVASYFEANKISTDMQDSFDKDEFRKMLVSKSICVWAECYRDRMNQ